MIKKTKILRMYAFGLHLLCSTLISIGVFAILYYLWYPAPLFALAGGERLFLIFIGCDVMLGPALTLIVFNAAKPRRELRRDLFIIITVQLIALIYGTHVMYMARPLYIVYNGGQFNITTANEIIEKNYKKMPASITANPKLGPIVVGTQPPSNAAANDTILFSAALGGADIYQMPEYFVPYSQVALQAASRALQASDFSKKHGGDLVALKKILEKHAISGERHGLIPVVMEYHFAVIVIDCDTGKIVSIDALPAGNP